MGLFSRMLHHLKGDSIERSFSREHHDVLMSQLQQQTSLLKLQENRQVIECLLPDSDDALQTIILGIDLYERKLLIDEPTPTRLPLEELIGKSITLRHQQGQLMLSFCVIVLDYNRVEKTLTIDLPQLFGAPWYAILNNISHGGMRIAVAGDLRDQLHKNLPIRRCDIELGFKKPLRCKGRVKSFSFYTRPYHHTLVSIMFEGLDDQSHAYLDDFLFEITAAA